MIHVFTLIWFFVAADGNQIMTQDFDSKQACEAQGAYMNDVSLALKEAKKITDFGGMCRENPNSNNGST